MLFVAIVAFVLVPAALVIQVWRDADRTTISVKVKPSGVVAWGKEDIPIAAMKSEFEGTVRLLKSQNIRPVLMIEVYNNASFDDAEQLAEIGRDAGFDAVTVHKLSWSYGNANSKHP